VIEFDQFVEYVTEGPTIHAVALQQHSLESLYTLETVIRGYIHAAGLGRALVSGAELALVFSEWTPETGLPSASGIMASMVLAGWTAKSVAVGYVIADSATLDAINASRTVAIALIRCSLEREGDNPLAPRDSFTNGQVTVLSTWINEHGITNSEFAALFDVAAAQLANWLQTHSRMEFAQQIHARFT
jgi:hypothetical protein